MSKPAFAQKIHWQITLMLFGPINPHSTKEICLNQFDTNRYLSTGFEIKYKNILFSYGILFQQIKALGIPQSFQITLYY